MAPLVRRLLLLLLLLLSFPIFTSALQQQSGCGLCASTGDCSNAFKGTPGQFCGTFMGETVAKPCCCPLYSTCKLTAHSCRCHVSENYYSGGGGGGGNGRGSTHISSRNNTQNYVLVGLIVLGVAVGAVACCVCCSSNNNTSNSSSSSYPYEHTPITYQASEVDPIAAPPPINPNYQSTNVYGVAQQPSSTVYYHEPQQQSGGMGNWVAGALGFGAGAAIGSAVTHQLDQGGGGTATGGGDRYNGGGGGQGYDIPGDTSGSRGGYGGYDISGDTGGGDDGGGYDIGGDDGSY